MLYIIIAIIGFGILIAVHELGHFLTAKLLGVRVNEFAIGMGPLLLSRQRGDTQYSLRLFPIGGYCAMEGEDEESDDPRAFGCQPGWKRLIILAAGSVMNFLAGFLIVLILFTGSTSFSTNMIAGFMEGFPLEGENGLMVGDRIISINGASTPTYNDVYLQLTRVSQPEMDLVIQRGDERIHLNDFPLTPQEYEEDGQTVLRYGLYFEREDANVWTILKYSVWNCVYMVKIVWYGLGDLISGAAGLNDLAGPIGIVDSIGAMGSQADSLIAGLRSVGSYIALIAINLAVMNLLPLPALDGGRIFFLLVNGVCWLLTKRKIPPKYEGYVHFAGFALLLALMIVVAFNDIVRIIMR